MRYVRAEYSLYRQELMYRIYLTDTLFYNADNKRLSVQFTELLHPQPQDTRTGDEIALDVIKKLGLNI